MQLCSVGAARETISSTWKSKSLGGTLMPWPPWDGAGALGCTPQQLNRAQAQPSHHSHLAAAFQGTGRGIPLDGSSNSPSVHLSRITMNLPTLPGLLLSKALTVWQGFGEQGAQTKETQLHSTRHIACHPSTYPASPGQKKSRKKEKTNCKFLMGWSCSSCARVGAGELLGSSAVVFS